MSEMRRIEKEITVNIGTLQAYGRYVDKIIIPELNAYIALLIKKEPEIETSNGKTIGIKD